MKTIEQKFEQAKKLTEKLVSSSNIQSERYYFVLKIFQNTRKQLDQELELIRLNNICEEEVQTEGQLRAKAIEEKRAVKEANVTSLTYEKAKKRLDNEATRWLTRSRK